MSEKTEQRKRPTPRELKSQANVTGEEQYVADDRGRVRDVVYPDELGGGG